MKPVSSLLCSALCVTLGTIAVIRPAAAATMIIRQSPGMPPPALRVTETLRRPEPVRIVERPGMPAPTVNLTERIVRPAPRINVQENVQEVVRQPIVAPLVINPVPDYAADYLTVPVYQPPIVETPIVQVPLLPVEHTVWQTSETINQGEGWVNTTVPVNSTGNRILLGVRGTSQIQSARVQFADGQTESVNLGQQGYSNETLTLMSFGGQRQVKSVQLTARSNAPQSEIRLSLQS